MDYGQSVLPKSAANKSIGSIGSGQVIVLISIDKYPRICVFSPNIIVFEAKIGQIRNLCLVLQFTNQSNLTTTSPI